MGSSDLLCEISHYKLSRNVSFIRAETACTFFLQDGVKRSIEHENKGLISGGVMITLFSYLVY
jgi:hypothetical protein